MLEASLVARVAVEKLGVVRAFRHLGLGAAQSLFQSHKLGAARQHVLAQCEVPVARRALVVERQSCSLFERELAGVD